MASTKLGFLRNALKPFSPAGVPIRSAHLRSLSTGATGEQDQDPASDPFIRPPGQGLIFGKLSGIGRNTLKSDIINFLDGCNLTREDVKVEYNRAYAPTGMIVQFPSRSVYDTALKLIVRKGRLYRLDKVDRSQWDLLTSYDGKAILLQGIPPKCTLPEDIERFLCGCNFDASSTQFFLRPGFPEPIRMAIVQFPTRTEAMNAYRVKDRSFCLNNPISMRVLQ